jgi:hypothetical protein
LSLSSRGHGREREKGWKIYAENAGHLQQDFSTAVEVRGSRPEAPGV